jgi:hypothetical protein
VALDSASNTKSIAGLTARRGILTSTSGTKWAGDGWVADMSSWQSKPLSVAPILTLALSADVGRDIANRYDQAMAFPMVLTLINGETGDNVEAVTLSVSSIRDDTLKASLYSVPDGYIELKSK